jgi:N-hydroxyarylamine O-acetyltransferase
MADDFDLDAYFRRIGHDGPARPDLATLTALHARHVAAIPFESLDPLAGRPVPLDLPSLQAKLVGRRRGGYCFEHNHLFRAALERIGFQVTGLGASVVWMSPPDAPLGPMSHMLLKVELPEGPYLADVGFGAHLLDAPLRLTPDVEQRTPASAFRLQADGAAWTLSARQDEGEGWRRAYVFTQTPQLAADYEAANRSTSTMGIFTSMAVIERLTGEARCNLVNTRLTERRRDGTATERTLASAEELAQVLDEVFDLEPPIPVGEIFAKIAG